jgi:hypothetical protein
MPTVTRRFQVAFSFPGEHRPLIAEVAARLVGRLGKDKVFYDKYHEAELARENLDDFLQHIYHDDAELLAIFLCTAYERKNWCGLEWRAIRDLMANRTVPARMFFRLDSGKVSGFFDGIDGYIHVEGRPPEELAGLVLERLEIERRRQTGQATPSEQDTRAATEMFEALEVLLESPAVKEAFQEYEEQLAETSRQINTLGQYKAVHDQLHSLQVHCYSPMWQEFQEYPAKPIGWDRLEEYANTLDNVLDFMRDAAEQDAFRQVEKERLKSTAKTLERGRGELMAAIQTSDPQQLRLASQRLRQVLATQPDYFSTNLSRLARDLDLKGLSTAMEALDRKLGPQSLDPEKLRQFEEGIAALGRLEVELNKMIDNHDRWQEFDTTLRRIGDFPEQLVQELQWSWEDLKEKALTLNSGGTETWEALIKDKTQELDQAVQTQPPDKVVFAFQRYRGWAVQRFYRVDRDLLKQCNKLCKVGVPLDTILGKHR